MKSNHSVKSIVYATLICCIITILMCGQSIATECRVTSVVDGDTVKCDKLRIRLTDIDAPEKKQKYGADATRFLANLVNGKTIRYDSNKKDIYGRVLARVYVNDTDVSFAMVEHGYAWAYMTKDKAIVNAMNEARTNRAGLWRDNNPKAPWLYRKGK